MESTPGSEFTMFEGDISGQIKSLKAPNLVEQIWDFGEQKAESLVRIELTEEPGKTRLELNHTNIPDEVYENIETGWKHYYLEALKSYLEN
jgi:activator of HSP90 ATPase